MKKLTPADYRISEWSGGKTTQLAIFPPKAVYADHDFLWRISSATVDLENSDFTPLPAYDRLIATLAGQIVLTHNGGAPLTLRPLEVHYFSGADVTHCFGRCTDFNLMLRRGQAEGVMEVVRLSDEAMLLPTGREREQRLLYCVEGSGSASLSPSDAAQKPLCFGEGEALLLDRRSVSVSGSCVLMACRMIQKSLDIV